MKRHTGKMLAILVAILVLAAGDAMARGGRGGRSGRGGGGGSFGAMQGGMSMRQSQYRYRFGGMAGAGAQQMMQNRYRWMQARGGQQTGQMLQQRLRDGSCAGRQGYGLGQAGADLSGRTQDAFGGMQRMRMRGAPNGASRSGQTRARQMQMMQNRFGGACPRGLSNEAAGAYRANPAGPVPRR